MEAQKGARGALFKRLAGEGALTLLAQFSGQGRPWLSALRELYEWARAAPAAGQPSRANFRALLERSLATLRALSDDDEVQLVGVLRQGIDVQQWITQPDAAPEEAYLASAPVSYPMIYLTEILLYWQFCHQLGLDAGVVGQFFKTGGVTGHSQGVVCAAVVALAKDDAHFADVAHRFLKYMFFHGLRVQQAYPSKTLPAKVVRDSLATSPPTPMLAVTGLPYTVLSKFIDKTNATFGAASAARKLYLSLVNGVDVCMVTGHPYALVNLQALLRTIQADQQENQDRVPFSKRKVKFHTGFTNVSVPFHCPLLEPAVQSILNDLKTHPALKDEGLLDLTSESFRGVPVWATHDNSRLAETPTRSIMHALVAMQCVQPVQWGLTCRKMMTEWGVTHVLDFSRGGAANSLGRMTQRNLDGTGVQILLAACEESDDNTVRTVVDPATGAQSQIGDRSNVMNIKGRAAWMDLPAEDEEAFPVGTNWRETFGPKLLRLKDGTVALRTRYSDLFNRPPLFVSGMTPCTAEEVLCSAVINAGYSVELAGGGQHTPQLFRQRIAGIAARTKPGEGIHINLLYLNPFLWNFQFPECLRLKKEEGFNIECLTIAAGVPGPEKVAEVCEAMLAVGISKLGFKPGTAGAIATVVDLAHRNPRMQFILQWTGGRSGGHHSMEDAHAPLLQTYSLIRTAPNIVLVFGGGLGDAESALPYLSGSWSLPYFKPPMPVDGLLFGSRVMVALEAPTDPAVKQLIVATPGVQNEKEWEQSLAGVAGGVVTVQSELGEPIHKIATRGILFWKEMDEKYFSIQSKDELKAKLTKDKNYIIGKLNDDFQKPYFGRKKDGLVVDLPLMTYEEVTLRLLDFFHPKVAAPDAASAHGSAMNVAPSASSGWIDITYFWKFRTWVLQLVSRFAGGLSEGAQSGFGAAEHEELFKLLQFDQPVSRLLSFLSTHFPRAGSELLSPDDEDFFLLCVCMQPGKPVNFVPLIDENLKLWFKKDSLWFSEDLRSIPNQDVQRCAVLHSPVSARFSMQANESVKSILDGIHTGLVQQIKKEAEGGAYGPPQTEEECIERQLLEDEVAGDVDWTDEMHALVARFATPADSPLLQLGSSAGSAKLSLTLPAGTDVSQISASSWRDLWASSGAFWVRSLFGSSVILRNKKHVNNYLAALLAPRAGTTVVLRENAVALYDDVLLGREHAQTHPAVLCSFDKASRSITVRIANPSSLSAAKDGSAPAAPVELSLTYTLLDSTFPYRSFGLLIEQDWASKVAAIVAFYRSLWLGPAFAITDEEERRTGAHTITAAEVARFVAATSDDAVHETPDGKAVLVPLDYSIVLGWTSIVTALIDSAERIRGDLLSLVHLSNEYVLPDEAAAPLAVGDKVKSVAEVGGVWIEPEGQVITITARLSRADALASSPVAVEVISRFAIRPSTGAQSLGAKEDAWFKKTKHAFLFVHRAPEEAAAAKRTNLAFKDGLNQLEVSTLLSKQWHDLTADKLAAALKAPGAQSVQQLELRFQCHETASKLETTGGIFLGGAQIASIQSRLASPAPLSCPVLAYSKRKCTPSSATPALVYDQAQSYPSTLLRAPASNRAYAVASKDVNVIHLNPYLIPLASLPTTITHGMYSSAKMRQAVAMATGASGVLHGRARIVRFHAEFRGMVLPGTLLRSTVRLLSMRDGLKQVEGELRDAATDTLVLRATAAVQQPPTAYLFTGQGSAQPNMGMELYGTSPQARAVWDAAEQFLREKYGFSILHIVRSNPKSLTVTFPRGQKGEEMKAQYIRLGLLKRPGAQAAASGAASPTPDDWSAAELAAATSYTFASSEGLLYATQFQQPGILLCSSAAFADLRAKGVVQPTAKLSGHSLGEYIVLSAALRGVAVPALAEVVFLRGLTMQNAVPRDSLNRSRYGMVAASPDRVGAFFTETHLLALVLALEQATGQLLQVVNFNVYNAQYVVAGGLLPLEALRVALDSIKKAGRKPEGDELARVVLEAAAAAEQKAKGAKDGYLPLTRGLASIPLNGLDVPFHSKALLGGVSVFRGVLQNTFRTPREGGSFKMSASEVVDKYVPNVLGLPFQLSKSYLQLVHSATGSAIVEKLISEYEQSAADLDELARLLIIELLAYQFASPVQWIKTQESLLRSGVSRFIEVGPQLTLASMLKRSTLDVGLDFLFIGTDMPAICFAEDGNTEEEEQAPVAAAAPVKAAAAPAAAAPAPVAAAPVAAAPRAAPAASSGGSSPSLPLSSLHSIRLLISTKLKLSFGDVDPSKSLKALAGGKSAVQNEVLGDIGNEFKAEPEGAAELPLAELANKVAGPAYAGPGKVLAALAVKNLSLALPGGWGKGKALGYLQAEFGLDGPTAEAVLVHALLHKVDKRLESESAAHAWLSSVAHDYAKSLDRSFSVASASGAAGAAGGASAALAAAIDPRELENLKALFRDQADTLSAYLSKGAAASVPSEPSLEGVTAEWLKHAEAELDVKFLAGVAPLFDKRRIRVYDASWNWAKIDVLELGLAREVGPVALESLSAEQQYLLRNRATPEVISMLGAGVNKQAAEKIIAPFVSQPPVYLEQRVPQQTHTVVTQQGKLSLKFSPRYAKEQRSAFEAYVADVTAGDNPRRLVLSHGTDRSVKRDDVLRQAMASLARDGASFAGKTALLTGCGVGSIGLEVARCLLLGGANVIVTTSSATRARMEMFRQWYRQWGARGARLTVIPFNGASKQDCEALVAEVGVPDLLLPFAAISENGRDIGDVDGLSELAHRCMLTNVIRLLGAIKNHTPPPPAAAAVLPASSSSNRYCHVILPLSPNRGNFGMDGLYAESKVGLETLYYKWHSEGWAERLGIVGAEIGWTKGTGLMSSNDLVAERMEKEAGLRTFDATEMAFNLTALLTEPVVELARAAPLHGDLSGGFASNKGGLPAGSIRAALQLEADIQRAIYTDALLDQQQAALPVPPIAGPGVPAPAPGVPHTPGKTFPLQTRARLGLEYPALPSVQDKSTLLEGMLDLTRVPVIVGFGEVGPWGNSFTRWERELSDDFTAAGAVQLARSMGLIKYHKGRHAALGREFIGWVDAKSNEPLVDQSIAARYAKEFGAHCGIRPIEPALFRGYDPARKMFLQQMSLAAPFKEFEVSSASEAEHLQRFHGDKLVLSTQADGKILARLSEGATIYVPKAVVFDRQVAGQIPTGWSPLSQGLPKDIVSAVDPVTHFALAACMDALAMAGLAADPYELYSKVHVSEVGNAIGSGMGGMMSLQGIFKQRLLDAQGLPSDQLQESFINTTAAWINMLLLSSCGPITTPVAACATAAVSLELGATAIRTGKAKVMFVGGTEDFAEEGSYEFAQMGATSNSQKEAAAGREPSEHCRPCTSTRAGFMEAQGAGIQILTSAAVALELGLPVFGVVAGVSTATDRHGRSIPAPGSGVLSTAREATSDKPLPLLSVAYRRRALESDLAAVDAWLERELAADDADVAFLHSEAERRAAGLRRLHGHDFFADHPGISPLRGALAAWGLGLDALEAVSFHGTSTVANDKNESSVVQQQMQHLQRDSSRPLPVICQKWLTGHPKGSAFGWMLNGMLQCLNSGLVPGNRNADNPDAPLRKFEQLVYPDKTTKPYGRPLRAIKGQSFGFGQAGAEVVIVHSNSLWGAVSSSDFSSYATRRAERHAAANRHWLEWLHDRRPLVAVKTSAPYSDADMHAVFLSPLARAQRDDTTGSWRITNVSGAGAGARGLAGADKSRLNLALRSLTKNISWQHVQRAGSSSQFLHVDSRGDVHSASPMPSPDSQTSLFAAGRASHSRLGHGMSRSESLVWSAPAVPLANQNLNTEVPASLGANPASFGASTAAAVAEEAALNAVGLTHSLSGVSLTSAAMEADTQCGVGVDVEETGTFEGRDASFLARNFSPAERAYCEAQPNPAASFAGKWAAKEAVLKALSQLYTLSSNASLSGLAGAGAPLLDIEVLAPAAAAAGQTLAPQVTLRGQAEQLAKQLNLASIQLSISHAGSHALSLAMARARPTSSGVSAGMQAGMRSAKSIANLAAMEK